ncbi:MAG: helix-turn-helix domain-containing protein [Nostoc sp.]|uniref:helix-turn-helix domain-containing protein n=1 Tax=Nostoc sp. TaxID=1180 RepID=UPI002FF7AAA6
MNNNPHLGSDALALLNKIVPDTPKTRLVERQELFRLALTQAMRSVRKRSGLNQTEIAQRLGVQQSQVSKLESTKNDHTFDSVLAYLNALGADLEATILVKKQRINVITANLDSDNIDMRAAIDKIFGDVDNTEVLQEESSPNFDLISAQERDTCREAQQVRCRQGGSWGRDSVA